MVGYADDKKAVLARLARIEGQVRGLERMIEQDVYCIDVLTQIAATTKSLESVALKLLGEHLNHCVHDAIVAGDADAMNKVDEANEAIRRLVRS